MFCRISLARAAFNECRAAKRFSFCLERADARAWGAVATHLRIKPRQLASNFSWQQSSHEDKQTTCLHPALTTQKLIKFLPADKNFIQWHLPHWHLLVKCHELEAKQTSSFQMTIMFLRATIFSSHTVDFELYWWFFGRSKDVPGLDVSQLNQVSAIIFAFENRTEGLCHCEMDWPMRGRRDFIFPPGSPQMSYEFCPLVIFSCFFNTQSSCLSHTEKIIFKSCCCEFKCLRVL